MATSRTNNVTDDIFEILVKVLMNIMEADGPEFEFTKNVGLFHHYPHLGETFSAWYARYQDIFECSVAHLVEQTRISMLLQKLDLQHYLRYLKYLRPKDPRELTFFQTIRELSSLYGDDVFFL